MPEENMLPKAFQTSQGAECSDSQSCSMVSCRKGHI